MINVRVSQEYGADSFGILNELPIFLSNFSGPLKQTAINQIILIVVRELCATSRYGSNRTTKFYTACAQLLSFEILFISFNRQSIAVKGSLFTEVKWELLPLAEMST